MAVNVSQKLEDMEFDRAQKLEQLREELKRDAHPAKWYAGLAVKAGVNLEYVSMRYGVPVETLQRWKDEWTRREQMGERRREAGS
jgi:hypothetical protein